MVDSYRVPAGTELLVYYKQQLVVCGHTIQGAMLTLLMHSFARYIRIAPGLFSSSVSMFTPALKRRHFQEISSLLSVQIVAHTQ